MKDIAISPRIQSWAVHIFWGLALSSLLACQTVPEPEKNTERPPSRAHAHNDYEHPRPLFDALDKGFASVEADIHLVDGALLVAHDADEVSPTRTLQSLYLDPLRKRFRENNGKLTPSGEPLILLVDFKTAAEPTYRALELVLESYRNLLTNYQGDHILPGALSVIISGNRPINTLAAQTHRWAAIDGRLPDLVQNSVPPSLIPLVSDNWKNHFTWEGTGPCPPSEQQKLKSLVNRAHEQERLIRFWGNPDQESYWRLARQVGVDLINTDNLSGLSSFLESSSESGRE